MKLNWGSVLKYVVLLTVWGFVTSTFGSSYATLIYWGGVVYYYTTLKGQGKKDYLAAIVVKIIIGIVLAAMLIALLGAAVFGFLALPGIGSAG